MALELRILSGARAGQREVFEKSVIAVGRHPLSDLRFDPDQDLDVSTKHAEIRGVNGRYTLRDNTSTNGTFVNGQRILPDRELHDGDRIAFGANGPQVEVHVVASVAAASPGPPVSQPSPARGAPAGSEAPRRSTTERIAVAVHERTSKLTRLFIAMVIVLGAGVGVAFWLGHASAAAQIQQLQQMLAQNEVAAQALNTKLAAADSNYAQILIQRSESLRARVASSSGASAGAIESLSAALRTQNAVLQLNAPAINKRNAPAVALLYSEIKGATYGGTAFGITASGLMITNRHNVQAADGTMATRLAISFRDTKDVLPAHVVKVSDDSTVDLALLQLDRPGPYPVVSGISGDSAAAPEGAPILCIGFPLATDLVMEGTGADMIAKSTLDPGTISKRVFTVLQIDSYAAHGSSGSPVFNAHGRVVGVVYGGPPAGGGRIVYAVPGDKLAAFLPAEARDILK